MGIRHENFIDDTVMEFPRGGFWVIHVIASFIFFILGMRFAFRRAPLPFVAYRILRRLIRK